MSTEQLIEELVVRQNWTDETLLGLCMEYILRQQNDDAFLDFLRVAADLENEVLQ